VSHGSKFLGETNQHPQLAEDHPIHQHQLLLVGIQGLTPVGENIRVLL